MRILAVVVAVGLVATSCTGSDDAESGAGDASGAATTTTGSSEMRPVPTVAPSTIAGERVGDADDGVIEVAPTIAPPDLAVDADPDDTVAPPSTDLVGDPQPSPDTTVQPPPTTATPPPPACDRLVGVGVVEEIESFIERVDSSSPIDGVDGCRYTAGGSTVDIWFVPLAEVRDDWFQRAGVEPVAAAGGEAVGLAGSIGADGSARDGYTVAVAGGGRGVVVAIADAADAVRAAGFVAALAAQAA